MYNIFTGIFTGSLLLISFYLSQTLNSLNILMEKHSVVVLLLKINMMNTIYFYFELRMSGNAPAFIYAFIPYLYSIDYLTFNLEDITNHRSMKVIDF